MSYIYLIKCEVDETILYKIGFSKNVNQRLKELKTGNPNSLEIVAKFQTKHNRKVESAFHNHYKHKNVNGEWFELLPEEVNKFLDNCQQMERNFDALKDNPFV
jgi:predicted GIY-YIG superfamily endonuclease